MTEKEDKLLMHMGMLALELAELKSEHKELITDTIADTRTIEDLRSICEDLKHHNSNLRSDVTRYTHELEACELQRAALAAYIDNQDAGSTAQALEKFTQPTGEELDAALTPRLENGASGKICAIKMYRERTGRCLADSKKAIEKGVAARLQS